MHFCENNIWFRVFAGMIVDGARMGVAVSMTMMPCLMHQTTEPGRLAGPEGLGISQAFILLLTVI